MSKIENTISSTMKKSSSGISAGGTSSRIAAVLAVLAVVISSSSAAATTTTNLRGNSERAMVATARRAAVTPTLCEFSEEKENVYLPDTIEQFPSLQDAKNACDSDMNCGGVTLYLSKYETRQGGALVQSNAGATSWVCGRSRPPTPCELSEEKENVYLPDTIEQFSSLQDAKNACDSDMNCGGVTLYNNKYETRQGGALVQSNAGATSWVCETACELSEEKENVYLPDTIEQFSSLQDAKNACDSDMNCGGVTLYNNNYETRQGGALLQSNAGASSWVCERSRLPSPPPPSPTPAPVTGPSASPTLCEFSEEKKDVYLPATIEQFPSLQDAKKACDSDMNCGGVTLYLSNYETRQGGAGPCLLQSGAGASSWVCERSRPPRPQARPGQGPDVPDSETCWSRTRDITTVAPEEWEYFLGFQESRRKGFSSPCGDAWTGDPTCNDPAAGKNHWPPNPVKVVFDCKMWVAAYRHAEDQAIQGYFSHFGEKPATSERERSERVGAQSRGEHQAGRDSSASGALNGLQGSPGHSNSMMQPKYKGMAVAHGKPGQRGIWTVLYNFGGDMIVDSESCIPEGYTATGDLL